MFKLHLLTILAITSTVVTAELPRPGTYVGDGLTLQLTAADGANYTGLVSLGAAKYALKGSYDDVKGLNGSFIADGKNFAWNAEVTGDAMKFTTAKSDYQLKRQRLSDEDNPLARRDAEPNPLAKTAAIAPATPTSAATENREVGGAGILLEPTPQGMRIVNLVPDGAGAMAGLQIGDVITAVDGQSIAHQEMQAVGKLIVGPIGSTVTLTVSRQDRAEDVVVKRAKLPAPPGTAAAPANGQAQTPAQGTLKFVKLSVKDPGINNIEAVSFLIPVGWQPEGGVQWMPDYSILANLLMKITDPKTGAQIEFLPVQKFTHLTNPTFPMNRFDNYMGQIVYEPITDLPMFVKTMYAPRTLSHLQNAQLVGQENLPKVAEQVARNYGGKSEVRSSRLRYAYDVSGQPWEEDVYLTLVYTPWQLGTMWAVDTAYSFRAPRGQLDRMTPTMMMTIKTCRLSLDWYGGYRYVQNLFNNRMSQDIKNATELSKTIARNADETRRLYADAYRERGESQDRINQSFGEYIKGVDTYKNPYEEKPVELPAGYKDAWVNRAGEYILSEQPTLDPNVGSTAEWRRMERRE